MEKVENENDVTFDHTLYNNKRWLQILERCFKLQMRRQLRAGLRHNYCKEVKGTPFGEITSVARILQWGG